MWGQDECYLWAPQGLATVSLELSLLLFSKTHTPVILSFDKQMTWQDQGLCNLGQGQVRGCHS